MNVKHTYHIIAEVHDLGGGDVDSRAPNLTGAIDVKVPKRWLVARTRQGLGDPKTKRLVHSRRHPHCCGYGLGLSPRSARTLLAPPTLDGSGRIRSQRLESTGAASAVESE
jgi:hypothetical protein